MEEIITIENFVTKDSSRDTMEEIITKENFLTKENFITKD